MPDIEAFTWNPLSDQTDTHFDHAVLMLGGNDEIVPPALTEYKCTSEMRIVSPNGYCARVYRVQINAPESCGVPTRHPDAS
jgi:hypothetical protein